MKEAFTENMTGEEAFSKELHRAVNAFVATATKEKVRELLKKARAHVFNEVATRSVLGMEPCEEEVWTNFLASRWHEMANKQSDTASDRHDLALAA